VCMAAPASAVACMCAREGRHAVVGRSSRYTTAMSDRPEHLLPCCGDAVALTATVTHVMREMLAHKVNTDIVKQHLSRTEGGPVSIPSPLCLQLSLHYCPLAQLRPAYNTARLSRNSRLLPAGTLASSNCR
jgi:hypothetical protein